MDPNTDHFLGNNDPLSESDRSILLNLSVEAENQIQKHRDIINRLVAQQERRKLLLSPIRRLPNELLLEICSYLPSRRFDSRVFLAVSQVCRRWYSTITGAADLWGGLVFHMTSSKEWDTRPASHFLDLCLRRARGSPLSLEICQGYWVKQLWDVLDQRVDRSQWREITADVFEAGDFVQALAEAIDSPESFPSLEKLSLFDYFHRPDTVPHMSKLKALTKLGLGFKNHGEGLTTAGIRWGEITELALSFSWKSHEYLDILEQCPRLRRCSIDPVNVAYDRDLDNNKRKVKLDCLTSFAMTECITAHSAQILASLQTPSLEEFAFGFYGNIDHNCREDVSGFIREHAATLRRLRLPVFIDTVDWSVLNRLEEVRVSDIIQESDCKDIIAKFCISNENKSFLLPRLHILEFYGPPIKTDIFVDDFVRKRNAIVKRDVPLDMRTRSSMEREQFFGNSRMMSLGFIIQPEILAAPAQ